MKARMDELEREKAEIIARQSKARTDTPDVHPNIASIDRRRVERFTDALHNEDDGRLAAEELRSLIEEVVLMPGEKRGEVHAKLRGELFGILDFVDAEHRQRPGEVRTRVKASPRNHLYLQPRRTRSGVFALCGNGKNSDKIAANVDLDLALDRRRHNSVGQKADERPPRTARARPEGPLAAARGRREGASIRAPCRPERSSAIACRRTASPLPAR